MEELIQRFNERGVRYLLIGGQAYPLDIFPGYEIVSSSFFEGVVNSYSPSIWEITLGMGGVAVALLVVTVAVRDLPMVGW